MGRPLPLPVCGKTSYWCCTIRASPAKSHNFLGISLAISPAGHAPTSLRLSAAGELGRFGFNGKKTVGILSILERHEAFRDGFVAARLSITATLGMASAAKPSHAPC